MDDVPIYQILLLITLVGFLPMSAYTYCSYRIRQRQLEVKRVLEILEIKSDYREIYNPNIGRMHFIMSVGFAMLIATTGLSTLLFQGSIELTKSPNLFLGATQVIKYYDVNSNPQENVEKEGSRSEEVEGNSQGKDEISLELKKYQEGALLAYGLGFLGAYLWGLQSLFRRYSMNDLIPLAFYRFGLRMLLSSVIALLIYHIVGGFTLEAHKDKDMFSLTSDGLLLATVFFIGMFPQRGLRFISGKMSAFSGNDHPSVRKLPLTMIEGMTSYDIFRIEELGIDTCYDLSRADFIPLLLKTSYGARELIDWILQAKLCVRFGESTQDLRNRGIRTITDLEGLDTDDFLEDMARETTLTLPGLKSASAIADSDENIKRLNRAADLLSRYWEGDRNREGH